LSYLHIAKAQLKVDEGVKRFPYRDTVGKLIQQPETHPYGYAK
jgi:hypothetical protein